MFIDRFWREFQPKRYARLRRNKTLLSEAAAAARLTADAMEPLLASGARYDEAWEQVRELYLFVPEEAGTKHEPMPENAAYAAMADFIRDLQREDDDDA